LEFDVLEAKVFDNVKNQIGFCGIWCGSCIVGNGALRELTRRFENVIEKYGLKEWASEGFDFGEFRKGLVSIQEASVCPGCLKDGGRDNCEMRSCASSKKLAGCCECDTFMLCENAGVLKEMRDGARSAGLLIKDKKVDPKDFIEKGICKLKKRFPSCILLCKEP
jgi:hypothetical protein